HEKGQRRAMRPGPDTNRAVAQTAFFSDGEALKRTVLPAFTLIDSPVRGLRPLRAFVLRTVKVPKLGRVNLPSFFSALTTASISSPAARLAAAPVSSADSCRTWAMNAFDICLLARNGHETTRRRANRRVVATVLDGPREMRQPLYG